MREREGPLHSAFESGVECALYSECVRFRGNGRPSTLIEGSITMTPKHTRGMSPSPSRTLSNIQNGGHTHPLTHLITHTLSHAEWRVQALNHIHVDTRSITLNYTRE